MIHILEQYIDDPKFINMIRDMLKAGYLEDWKYHSTYSGAPQGGIISPLLSNIYLHELDTFVARLATEFDRGKKRNLNLVYHRLSRNIQTLYKKVDLLKSQGKTTEADEVIQTLKTMIEERSKFPSGDPFDAGYKRLRYCRYADDSILGIIGSKKDAITLKDEVENFLRLNLSLSISAEKSQVVKATDGIVYLGYGVRNFSPTRKTRGVRGSRRVLRKAGSDLMQLYIPRRKIVTFCQKHGYGNYDQRSTTHRPGLLYREDVEIVMAYNSELRGFANYYKLVGDFKTELRILHFLWFGSLLKTLAAKHQSTVAKMQKLLRGRDHYQVRYSVQGKSKVQKVFKLKDIKVKSSRNPDIITDTLRFASPRTSILDRLNASRCEYCQKEDGYFEVHHVRKLKDLSNKTPWERRMIEIRRKTIVLCIDCHQELHRGTLPDYRHLRKK